MRQPPADRQATSLGRRVRAVGAAMALCLAALSLLLNISSYLLDSVAGIPLDIAHWGVLHLTGFFLVPLAAATGGAFRFRRGECNSRRNSRPWTQLPKWLGLLFVASFVFFFVNSALFATRIEGSVGTINGRLALTNHGMLIRFITPDEARRNEALELRGFTGVWTVAYTVAAAFFLRRTPPPSAKDD